MSALSEGQSRRTDRSGNERRPGVRLQHELALPAIGLDGHTQGMLFVAVRARSRGRRHPRRTRCPCLPILGLLWAAWAVGLRSDPTGSASRWWHRLGDSTTRTMPSMRPHPRVRARPGVPETHRQCRDRLGGPDRCRQRARTSSSRRTGRRARHNGQRLAASSPSQQRHHGDSCHCRAVGSGPRRLRTPPKARLTACLHGPHDQRRSMRVEATLRHSATGARFNRDPPTDRVVRHRRLATGRERAHLSADMEARLSPNPVCFVAPENPPSTAQVWTNTPKPSSPQVSKPSSFRLAVNNCSTSAPWLVVGCHHQQVRTRQ